MAPLHLSVYTVPLSSLWSGTTWACSAGSCSLAHWPPLLLPPLDPQLSPPHSKEGDANRECYLHRQI